MLRWQEESVEEFIRNRLVPPPQEIKPERRTYGRRLPKGQTEVGLPILPTWEEAQKMRMEHKGRRKGGV
jgi:hypothetical protein